MTRRIALSAAAVVGAIALCTGMPTAKALANRTVTFDSLAPNFAPIHTYTEGGFKLEGGSASKHFHTVTNGANNTTAARDFNSDGDPITLSSTCTDRFTLVSIDVVGGNTSLTFTASNGATQTITPTPGTQFFNPGFRNISSATFVNDGPGDNHLAFDNVVWEPKAGSGGDGSGTTGGTGGGCGAGGGGTSVVGGTGGVH